MYIQKMPSDNNSFHKHNFVMTSVTVSNFITGENSIRFWEGWKINGKINRISI